jgi:glutamate synthase domain-containing protein 1/glutamate synthase domain-containing protein 3
MKTISASKNTACYGAGCDPRLAEKIIASRAELLDGVQVSREKAAEEGGCGVVGFAATVPVRGHHIFEPSIQMHNRGNGKGGGIAAASLQAEDMGVDEATLRDDYILQIAMIDPAVEVDLENFGIYPYLQVDHKTRIQPVADYWDVGLEMKPPDIVRYFVRVRDDVLDKFAKERGMDKSDRRAVEDEFMFRNSFRINGKFYASLGDKRAFVLSHARDLVIFKVVGYAEQVVRYYGLDDMRAKIWIAHQRYPTKGKVWHPAGAHPFIGMNEALVHNGDFANYFGVSEYLRQKNLVPQFLTDTEVSVLLFDLLTRVYGYPLEYVIEAMAPTTEIDFDTLPEQKKKIYRAIQAQHIHGSPDGPWFFIIARSAPDKQQYQLLGITDTSMLRPQVFAIQEGDVSIGLIGSEKQAIDATLRSLSAEDPRFRHVADRYWNARGGSYTDGGAFIFTVNTGGDKTTLTCTDKFETPISAPAGEWKIDLNRPVSVADEWRSAIASGLASGDARELFGKLSAAFLTWNLGQVRAAVDEICAEVEANEDGLHNALQTLTLLQDRRFDCGCNKRSALLHLIQNGIDRILDLVPPITVRNDGLYHRVDFSIRNRLSAPKREDDVLVVFSKDFPPEGDDCDALLLADAYRKGWKHFIVYGMKGQRFTGCSFGPGTDGVRIDVYGSSGDYIASGIDGMEIHIHGNAQDQLGQILKRGKLVIHGDVGQAFMYGAKGGEVYIMGNAAGRPLINAAGRPRVVINGTCLDFLAESFMAGDPHNGGGFVVLNGVEFDDRGAVREQQTPYPGSNLFSLASGGAIFVRDPHRMISDEKLNGTVFTDMTDEDWNLIRPYLEENERLFGISVERDLLKVKGESGSPLSVYRKVCPVKTAQPATQKLAPEKD